MESMNKYKEIMEKEAPNELENQKLEEFYGYLRQIKTFKEYAPPISEEHLHDYEHEMEMVKYLNSLKPNEHYEREIKEEEEIQKIISLEEVKQQKQMKEEEKVLKLTKNKERRAGYTNASILIFITINLGLFLASLILLLK